MNTLIVYYSLEGNTEYTAGKIAGALGADMLRVEPVEPYPTRGLAKFLFGGKGAVMKATPALKPYAFDGAKYDRIVLGFPVWAGNITPPIRSFLWENDLKGKQIAAFVCESGAGGEKALKRLADALGLDGLEAQAIFIDPKSRPSAENDRKLRAFCEALKRN
ncbi:MAG: flavodoxin family protein [bacterium]